MNNAIIGAEALSIIICAVILFGNEYKSTQKNKERKAFSYIILTLIFALVADMLSWIFDGKPDFILILNISSCISMVSCFAITFAYTWYLYQFINEKSEVSFKPFGLLMDYSVVAFVATAIGSFAGKLYTFDNGVYVEGSLYDVYLAANAVCLIGGFVILLKTREELGSHDSVAAMMYIIIPMCSMIINSIFPSFSMTYPAITISVVIVFVMMQAEHERVLIQQEVINVKQMKTDDLTGILNRRAYTERIELLARGNNNVGVIFCDINGLKYTNDNMGHEAGDKLICDFANLLLMHFRRESIFRISGDEFVIIMPTITADALKNRHQRIANAQSAFGIPIASLGASYGVEYNLRELIQEAEHNMYDNKEAFYNEYPKFRR